MIWDILETVVDFVLPAVRGLFRLFSDIKVLFIIALLVILAAVYFVLMPVGKALIIKLLAGG